MPLPRERYYTSEDYWNLPEDQRAELIDGQLYNMAPPNRIHQKLVQQLSRIIGNYIVENHGSCEVYPAPFAVNLDAEDKNWVEPDISVICDKNKLTDRGCSGAPDLIIEIVSPSTANIDYLKKLLLYQKNGVREYWIVNPDTRTVMVYGFGKDSFDTFTFEDAVPVGIYGDLLITIDKLLS